MMAVALIAGCNSSSDDNDLPTQPPGRWLAGDIHVHSTVSADARDTMRDILHYAFDEFKLDYVFFSNHMRDSSQDNQDNDVGKQLYYQAMLNYELPEIQALQQSRYKDKVISTTFEWDMPAHEHFNIGIFTEAQEEFIEAVKLFEYQFSSKNTADLFEPQDVAKWEQLGIKRYNGTDEHKHQDALKAMTWLQDNYPTASWGLLNHPLRYKKSYTISDIRDLHNAAPNVFFMIEGMVGGQLGNNRGDYNVKYASDHPDASAGVFGGVDPVVATVGGWWDALLSEGRQIWNVANSDHHFKIREPYTSSYYPGEYAKTYTYVEGEGEQAILEGLRSGNTFATYGDLIHALDFTITANGKTSTMGQSLEVKQGDQVTVTIRFKSPAYTNQEITVGDGYFGIGEHPSVHHVDLISGSVNQRIEPQMDAYYEAKSDAEVVKSFTQEDWEVDRDGYQIIKYRFEAKRDEYYRLRGTALDYNVDGLTVGGEPQKWVQLEKYEGESERMLRNRINARIYQDIWFYSNPVFITLN